MIPTREERQLSTLAAHMHAIVDEYCGTVQKPFPWPKKKEFLDIFESLVLYDIAAQNESFSKSQDLQKMAVQNLADAAKSLEH